MSDRAATLKLADQPDLDIEHPTQQLPVEIKHARKQRFAYPSGSRPLTGYTIKRGIGVGGFGEVYFALSDAGKEVALKCIQRNLDIELRGVRQCLNLKHINLIRLWDICTSEDGQSWVVMEYVPGDSLRQIVEANPDGMPMEQVHRWFLSTASGVAYLHSRGIVHRDLKPGNIFFDQDEQLIKIGDYGLSKFMSCSRRSGQTESVGTFHYMAPEIGKGVYGKEIDIYALGIILFEMLTGNVPFDGESSQEIIMKHLTADPDVSMVPQPYAAIIAKAMRKDPEQRYRHVQELIADFPSASSLTDQIGPIASVNSEAKQNDPSQSKTDSETPPVQPLIINDPEIVFGQVVDASNDDPAIAFQDQVSVAGVNGNSRVDVQVERVQVIAADHANKPEEPIARAVVGGWEKFQDWWFRGKLNAPLKIVIVIVGGLILLKNSDWLFPTALGLGFLYLIYYGIRGWLIRRKTASPARTSSTSAKQAVKPTKTTYVPNSKKQIAQQQQTALREMIAQRPLSDRIAETLGSLLAAGLITSVLGILGFTIASYGEQRGMPFVSMGAWAILTSLTATSALLVAGKFFETSDGDPMLRRFTMLSIGLLVGLSAIVAGSYLELDTGLDPRLQTQFMDGMIHTTNSSIPFASQWPSYLISFAGVFAALRWWRMTDPTRKTRLSLFSVGICIVAGVLFGSIFGLNIAWTGIVVGVTAVATQCASPWIHPDRRLGMLQGQPLDFAKATQVAGK